MFAIKKFLNLEDQPDLHIVMGDDGSFWLDGEEIANFLQVPLTEPTQLWDELRRFVDIVEDVPWSTDTVFVSEIGLNEMLKESEYAVDLYNWLYGEIIPSLRREMSRSYFDRELKRTQNKVAMAQEDALLRREELRVVELQATVKELRENLKASETELNTMSQELSEMEAMREKLNKVQKGMTKITGDLALIEKMNEELKKTQKSLVEMKQKLLINMNKCSRRPYLQHGSLDLPLTENGPFQKDRTINFKCDKGYKKGSILTFKCIGNNKWESGKCFPKSCGDPGLVENADQIGNVFTFENWVEYKCEPGFFLNGPGKIQCTENGWNPSKPFCIKCPPLNPIVNGMFEFELDGKSVKYRCNPDYRLHGDDTRTCTSTGTWSGKDPTCEFICKPPKDPKYGKLVGVNKLEYVDGDYIYFTCDYAADPTKKNIVHCTLKGWNKPILCPPPPSQKGSFWSIFIFLMVVLVLGLGFWFVKMKI